MSINNPNDPIPPPGVGEPTRQFPESGAYDPYAAPTQTNLPAASGLPPVAAYQPTQVNPTLPPDSGYAGGPPLPPDGGNPGAPPMPPGGPPPQRTPLPWIIGGVAGLLLLGLIIFFVTRPASGGSPTPTPVVALVATATVTPFATDTPVVVLVTATPAPLPPTEAPSPTPIVVVVTPPPSDTPVVGPATVTPVPPRPSDTAVPPTPVPPPPTPVPPTPVPPSATPVPPRPTNTAVPPPPTNTLAPPSPTAPSLVTVAPATIISAPSQTPEPGATMTSTVPAGPSYTPALATPPPAVASSLSIQWFGQDSVLLVTPDGNTIFIDPTGPQSGYQLPNVGHLHAILSSRDDPDYNNGAVGEADQTLVAVRDGRFTPLDAQLSDARIQAVQSSGSNPDGSSTTNAVWVVDIPNFYIVHLGGMTGALPQSTQLRPQPDILFLPVGGGNELDSSRAVQVIQALQPKLVIPMNYQTDVTPPSLRLTPIDRFLQGGGFNDVQRIGHTLTLKPSDLPTDGTRIVVMNYK